MLQKIMRSTSKQAGAFCRYIAHLWESVTSCIQCGTGSDENHDIEARGCQEVDTQMYQYEPKDRISPTSNRPSESTAINESISSGLLSLAPTPANSPVNNDFPEASTPNSPTAPPLGKQLWKNAVRNVTMRNALARTTQGLASVVGASTKPRPEPVRQRTVSSGLSFSSDGRKTLSGQVYTRSRLSALVPKLMELEATHDLAAHSALVRHMQFSPDGKFLATSRLVPRKKILHKVSWLIFHIFSWDKTSVIFRVGVSVLKGLENSAAIWIPRVIVTIHTSPHACSCPRFCWPSCMVWVQSRDHWEPHDHSLITCYRSPTGEFLLTKMARGVKVWTAEVGRFVRLMHLT